MTCQRGAFLLNLFINSVVSARHLGLAVGMHSCEVFYILALHKLEYYS